MTGPPHTPPPVFVLSTGRCGSTLLSNILNLHPRILSLSEFVSFTGIAPFSWRNPDGQRMWRVLAAQPRRMRLMLAEDYEELLYPFGGPDARYTRRNIPPILCTTLPHLPGDHHDLFDRVRPAVLAQPRQPAADHYRALFGWLCARLGRSWWVERSGASLLFASTLLRAFPDARVVHLYRDGRAAALSMSRHYLYRLIASTLRGYARLGADPYRLIAADPDWDRKALRLYRLSRLLPRPVLAPRRAPPLEEFGKLWTAMIRRAEMLLRHLPADRVHRLRFEDLCTDPRDQLAALIDFIDPGLRNGDWLAQAAALPRFSLSGFPHLPKHRSDELARACQPGLRILGYHPEFNSE